MLLMTMSFESGAKRSRLYTAKLAVRIRSIRNYAVECRLLVLRNTDDLFESKWEPALCRDNEHSAEAKSGLIC